MRYVVGPEAPQPAIEAALRSRVMRRPAGGGVRFVLAPDRHRVVDSRAQAAPAERVASHAAASVSARCEAAAEQPPSWYASAATFRALPAGGMEAAALRALIRSAPSTRQLDLLLRSVPPELLAGPALAAALIRSGELAPSAVAAGASMPNLAACLAC